MSNSAPSSSSNNPPVAVETYQPTVRVMRLYKPGFHVISSVPYLSIDDYSQSSETCATAFSSLSPFLLLPDSFGDIYSGEKFSAYIAVVNGFQNVPFYQVSLAIRLQTTSTVIDLLDSKPSPNSPQSGYPKTLNYNDTSDMIVQHTLTELGIHTLRVSVQYLMSPTSEPKTLRKFYRFNVLQPLIVTSNFVELDNKPMVQCQITNATKTPVYIDEINFIPLNRYSTCVSVGKPQRELTVEEADEDLDFFESNVRLLQPEESLCHAFVFTKHESSVNCRTVGHPEVRWCTTMGEFSLFKGEDTLLKGSAIGSSAGTGVAISTGNNSVVKIQCMSCPSEVKVGQIFEVVLRVSNNSARPVPVRLQCMNSTSNSDVYYSATNNTSNNSGANPSTRVTSMGNVSPVNLGGNATVATASSCLGLCVTGLTYAALGTIESGEFVDTTLSVYALCSGLHDLQGVYAVDSVTKQRYFSDSLCKVLVVDCQEEDGEQCTVKTLQGEFAAKVAVF